MNDVPYSIGCHEKYYLEKELLVHFKWQQSYVHRRISNLRNLNRMIYVKLEWSIERYIKTQYKNLMRNITYHCSLNRRRFISDVKRICRSRYLLESSCRLQTEILALYKRCRVQSTSQKWKNKWYGIYKKWKKTI